MTFERFNEPATQVIGRAQEEARVRAEEAEAADRSRRAAQFDPPVSS